FTDVTSRTRAEDQARAAAAETARLLATTEEARRALLAANEEQKRADEALIYERNLLVALMESQPDRIFFADASGRFIKVSRVEAQAMGLASPEAAIGKTLEELRPGEASRRIMATDLEIIRSGRPLLAHVEENIGSDGSVRWDSVSKAPIRNQEGKAVGIVGIIRDITSQIEMQQQLQHASKMDAIGRLAGGVAHDFNNLLQAILGFTELLLLDRTAQDRSYEDIKQIERAAGRAIGLTRQLLTFGRKQRIEAAVVEVNQVIGTSEKMLLRLTGTEVTLNLALAPDAGQILADPSQIEQILMNLTVNAKDAMPGGGRLDIRTERLTLTEDDATRIPESFAGDFVCLTVSDTGCGIPPDVMAHLFEPFYTTKERGKGTGLGLSVIHGIVKQSRGWINVYTAPNQGTTFKIFFPAVQAATDDTQTEPPPAAHPAVPLLPGDGHTVLLVEDEPGVRQLAERILKTAGYRVFTCANAAEALVRFEREGEHVDLLFSDIAMAGQ
ncbi:MAG: PAS domain S-box protein, partial [Lentisphaerae bacterium]|nr:PAS domain S-box protein [Lentisphaerota bacterium]